MGRRRRRGLVTAICTAMLAVWATASGQPAQERADEEKKLGWTNSTNLSIVVSEGNSNTETFGFTDIATRTWKRGWGRIKLDAVRSDSGEDRIVVIAPGVTFPPGADPEEPLDTFIERPPSDPDVEKYFAEARYERIFPRREQLTWNTGTSWDRNEDAGILNRYVAFLGVGHAWHDKEAFKFKTSYSLSYTDREEDPPDPEKDERFGGLRLSLDFLDRWGKVATYENDFTANFNLTDPADQAFDMTNAISVTVSDHLALKLSLQHLFNSEPALEDVDLVARVIIVDPDGVPGSGDEFFETVAQGGAEITVGETAIRKEELDTTFRTSLVINF
jgi:hypothetical protein